MAAWQAGGVRLLEALLSLGRGGGAEQRSAKVAEDAARLMGDIVSAQPNREGLLASGGADLLVNMLRLGPSKVGALLAPLVLGFSFRV